MIINYNESGWDVITQRTHGLVAAQLACYWKKDRRPERWTEMLLAIAEHDDAEVELDGEELLNAAHGPLNYTMKNFNLEHCRKMAMLTVTKSRFITLMVSMHMEFLYRTEAKTNPTARSFLQEQQKIRAKIRKELKISALACEKSYSIIEWLDACSLLLCQRAIPPENRSVEISHGPNKEKYYLFQDSQSRLTVSPWPFELNSFPIAIEYRSIGKLEFKDAADFRQAFLNAPVSEITYQFHKSARKFKPKTKNI